MSAVIQTATTPALLRRLRDITHVALDMDGTIYKGLAGESAWLRRGEINQPRLVNHGYTRMNTDKSHAGLGPIRVHPCPSVVAPALARTR
jgi:hypothetical protein